MLLNFAIFSLMTISVPSLGVESANFGASLGVWSQITNEAKTAPVLILAEPHDQPALSDVVESLARVEGRESDCLFVEVSVDLQSSLDRFVKNGDEAQLAQDIYKGQIPHLRKAWTKIFAHQPQALRQIDQIFGPLSRQDLGRFLLTTALRRSISSWARQANARIWAYDVPLQSRDRELSHYYQTLSSKDPRRFNQVGARFDYLSVIHRRNEFMADQIAAKVKSGACARALVVVGADHVLSTEEVEARTSSQIQFRPLNQMLNQQQVETAVLLIESNQERGAMVTRPVFTLPTSDLDAYWNPIGLLQLPYQAPQ